MNALLGYLNWELGAKGQFSDPGDKTFLGLCIVNNVSNWSNILLKKGLKTSVAGSRTNAAYRLYVKAVYMVNII